MAWVEGSDSAVDGLDEYSDSAIRRLSVAREFAEQLAQASYRRIPAAVDREAPKLSRTDIYLLEMNESTDSDERLCLASRKSGHPFSTQSHFLRSSCKRSCCTKSNGVLDQFVLNRRTSHSGSRWYSLLSKIVRTIVNVVLSPLRFLNSCFNTRTHHNQYYTNQKRYSKFDVHRQEKRNSGGLCSSTLLWCLLPLLLLFPLYYGVFEQITLPGYAPLIYSGCSDRPQPIDVSKLKADILASMSQLEPRQQPELDEFAVKIDRISMQLQTLQTDYLRDLASLEKRLLPLLSAPADLQVLMAQQKQIGVHIDELKAELASTIVDLRKNSELLNSNIPGVDNDVISQKIAKAIALYDADKIGEPDFALANTGGSVVTVRCSETYRAAREQLSIFNIPILTVYKSPETVLSSDVSAGECWPFVGDRGHIVIKLAAPIKITAVSIDHLPRTLSFDSSAKSAPKDFDVFALKSETDQQGSLLGAFTYDNMGSALQRFFVKEAPDAVQFLEFSFKSNHGNSDYTCIYRLRVHGELAE